jgi:hypothetical protein
MKLIGVHVDSFFREHRLAVFVGQLFRWATSVTMSFRHCAEFGAEPNDRRHAFAARCSSSAVKLVQVGPVGADVPSEQVSMVEGWQDSADVQAPTSGRVTGSLRALEAPSQPRPSLPADGFPEEENTQTGVRSPSTDEHFAAKCEAIGGE